MSRAAAKAGLATTASFHARRSVIVCCFFSLPFPTAKAFPERRFPTSVHVWSMIPPWEASLDTGADAAALPVLGSSRTWCHPIDPSRTKRRSFIRRGPGAIAFAQEVTPVAGSNATTAMPPSDSEVRPAWA